MYKQVCAVLVDRSGCSVKGEWLLGQKTHFIKLLIRFIELSWTHFWLNAHS